jgi:hypothetical protein
MLITKIRAGGVAQGIGPGQAPAPQNKTKQKNLILLSTTCMLKQKVEISVIACHPVSVFNPKP